MHLQEGKNFWEYIFSIRRAYRSSLNSFRGLLLHVESLTHLYRLCNDPHIQRITLTHTKLNTQAAPLPYPLPSADTHTEPNIAISDTYIFRFFGARPATLFVFFCNFLFTVLMIQYSSLVTSWHACYCAGKNLHSCFPASGFSWAELSEGCRAGFEPGAALKQPGALTT